MSIIKKLFNTVVVVFLLTAYFPPIQANEPEQNAANLAAEQEAADNSSVPIAQAEQAAEAIDGQVAHDSFPNAWQQGSGLAVQIATSENIYQSVQVDSLKGKRVVNLDAKSVGKVRDVVLADNTNTAALVIETGGFFGIGATESLVPLEDFYVVGEQLVWETSLSKDEVKKSDQFDYDESRFSSLLDE